MTASLAAFLGRRHADHSDTFDAWLHGDEGFRALLDYWRTTCAEGTDANRHPAGSGPFGRVATNPVPCRTIFGSVRYLSLLRTPDGTRVDYERVGSTACESIPHPIDIYELRHEDGTRLGRLYISPYQRRNSALAPEGLSLAV